MIKASLSLIAFAALFVSCASESKPDLPTWTQSPTRTVDNGYIVYIGSGMSRDNDKAQFKAEGVALEDLANECSFLPKGVRLEDRYLEKGKNENTAYVKVAVEFQSCVEAQKTIEPSEIKKLANVSFTEQLRRYQDLEETGEMPDKSEYGSFEVPAEIPPAPVRESKWNDSMHFAVMRQYVAYQKETVILAPAKSYAPQSPESTQFISALQPAVGQIQETAAKTPALAQEPHPWSKMMDRPRVERPAVLQQKTHKSAYNSALPYIQQNAEIRRKAKADYPAGKKKSGKGKKKKHSA
jgi:hypothetical protein